VSAVFLPPLPPRPATPAAPQRPCREPAPAASALVGVLRQLADLLAGMTDEQYRARADDLPGAIGGHVRHCLDHVAALLGALDGGTLDYDRRQRGTDVETSRAAALDVIRRLTRQLLDFPAGAEGRPLRLSAVVAADAAPVVVDTSVGREMAFVLSHTIHHNALIGVLAVAQGVPLPERFGYAPSTIAHLEEAARCAR
jgi:hypothetical protein